MNTLESLQAALSDRYRFEREIGAGGMATVYLARDLRHDREVAVKVLKPELGAVLGAERFLSEIKVTANLQHPNLLPLFDSGEANGLLYYVMPFVQGETLRARLDRELQLPVEEAVRIAVAIASALGYAHEHGVIHRDLKPENILMQAGQPVIADFGIALAVSNAGGARVTQTGLSLGTPQYMSPEQAAGDREIGPRSDIYSLGAVTYEMLGGEPPHTGTSAQAIIAKLMTKDPAPLHSLRRTVPVHVAASVEKALAKLPADRFATAQEFAAAMTNPSFTIAAGSSAGAYGGAIGAKKWKRATIAVATVAVVLAGVALWALLRPAPAKPVRRYVVAFDSTEMFRGAFARIALSPDGSRLAYTGGRAGPSGGSHKLFVWQRDQLRPTAISGVEQAASPFFSSDGSRVGYIVPPYALKVASLNGGPSITISDSVGTGGASWGPDGFIYATALVGLGIIRFAENPTAIPKRLTRVDSANGEAAHRWPEPLPNGKGVLFTIRSIPPRPNAVAVLDLKSGKYRVLVTGLRGRYSASGHLLYVTQEGTLMQVPFDQDAMKITGDPTAVSEGLALGGVGAADFATSADGTLAYVTGGAQQNRELVWVSRDGKVESIDSTWPAEFEDPVLSKDGKQLAVTLRNSGAADIWIKQLDRGPSLKLTFDGTFNDYSTWTPDGRSVTFRSNASHTEDLWTKRADGSAQAVALLHQSRPVAEPLWSADSKWLVFRTSTRGAGSGDILAIRPGIDSIPTAIAATKFTEFSPTLSPDGRWMAYSSNETGQFEIYVVPFPNADAAKWPISTHGGVTPLWSHHGSELFYIDGAGNMVSVAVKTAPTFSLGATATLFPARQFILTAARRQFDATADDQRFVMIRPIGGSTPDKLIFVDNWFAELKSKSKK